MGIGQRTGISLRMINNIVVYRGNTVDYHALNCGNTLKPGLPIGGESRNKSSDGAR